MSQKRSSVVVVLLALLLVAMIPAIALAADTHEGTIKSVDADNSKLVVTVGGEDKEFTVDAAAEITLDGAAAKLADLAAGQMATVTSEVKDGVMHASKVAATKAK